MSDKFKVLRNGNTTQKFNHADADFLISQGWEPVTIEAKKKPQPAAKAQARPAAQSDDKAKKG